jgi:hypothetical protein
LTAASQVDFEAGRLRRRSAHAILQELRERANPTSGMSESVAPTAPRRHGSADRAKAFRMRRSSSGIGKLITEADSLAHSALSACAKNGWSLPELGYEPTGPDGSIIGLVELAWPKKRIAAVTPEQKACCASLAESGWTIIELPVDDDALRLLLE